jgi:hypothetical protein
MRFDAGHHVSLESKLMFVPMLRLPLLRTLLLARVAAVLRAASLFVVLHPTRPTSTGVSNFRRLGGGKGAMFCLNCCCCVVASCVCCSFALSALCALRFDQRSKPHLGLQALPVSCHILTSLLSLCFYTKHHRRRTLCAAQSFDFLVIECPPLKECSDTAQTQFVY